MPLDAKAEAPSDLPLVVDVDGGLLHSGLLLENFWAALHADPVATLSALARGRGLAGRLARIGRPDPVLLPLREAVVERIRAARTSGRPVHLISRADPALVEDLAAALGPEIRVGMPGTAGYEYLATAPPDPAQPGRLASLLRAMRPPQWAKNLLLFFPLFLAREAAPGRVLSVLVALAGFCALTSSVYLVNDLLDLDADRRHPEKRARPIASGALSVGVAMAAVPALLVAAFALGLAAGPSTALVLAVYLAIAWAYSLWLKHLLWADLLALAGLYALRVLAGAEAARLDWPEWPVAFSFAAFLALATVKRLTALARTSDEGPLPGRAYRRADRKPLLAIGLAGTLAAVATFLVYSFTAEAAALYSHHGLLRLAALPIAAWLLRMLFWAWRGKEDYDPLVFVGHDRTGLAIVAVGLALFVLAV